MKRITMRLNVLVSLLLLSTLSFAHSTRFISSAGCMSCHQIAPTHTDKVIKKKPPRIKHASPTVIQ